MCNDPRPEPMRCDCGHRIFYGELIRSRCAKPADGLALCRCKRWVEVPVTAIYSSD